MRRDTREISQKRVAKSGRPDATDTTLAGSIASHFSNETPVRTCFSATASFVTVGTTTAVGIACLSKVRQWRELPLASLPLIFAVQQAVEGCLWLTLPVDPDGPVASLLGICARRIDLSCHRRAMRCPVKDTSS